MVLQPVGDWPNHYLACQNGTVERLNKNRLGKKSNFKQAESEGRERSVGGLRREEWSEIAI